MAAPADDPKVMVYYVFVSTIINFDDEPIKMSSRKRSSQPE
ncbi:MAG: hypothetical protein ACLVJ6_01160 [Merdibacter sp.]